MDEFWPGALTIILPARQEIGWDLGETGGTVALRMPDNPIALALLQQAGPMAVSSANLTAQHPAATAQQARDQLGDKVAVYLDGGKCGGGEPSTIVIVGEKLRESFATVPSLIQISLGSAHSRARRQARRVHARIPPHHGACRGHHISDGPGGPAHRAGS